MPLLPPLPPTRLHLQPLHHGREALRVLPAARSLRLALQRVDPHLVQPALSRRQLQHQLCRLLLRRKILPKDTLRPFCKRWRWWRRRGSRRGSHGYKERQLGLHPKRRRRRRRQQQGRCHHRQPHPGRKSSRQHRPLPGRGEGKQRLHVDPVRGQATQGPGGDVLHGRQAEQILAHPEEGVGGGAGRRRDLEGLGWQRSLALRQQRLIASEAAVFPVLVVALESEEAAAAERKTNVRTGAGGAAVGDGGTEEGEGFDNASHFVRNELKAYAIKTCLVGENRPYVN